MPLCHHRTPFHSLIPRGGLFEDYEASGVKGEFYYGVTSGQM